MKTLVSFLLAFLLLAAPAEATWPGQNGAIAFARNTNIWLGLPWGDQLQLTQGPGADAEPTYSRDGHKIAYVHHDNHGSEIWVMRSDGTGLRPVTDEVEGTFESQPAFFPSGRSLAFVARTATGITVFSIKLDGTGLRPLAQQAKNPAISPDGRLLAFSEFPGNRLRLKDLRSGAERQLPSGNAQEPDFSPDGKRLVFVGQRPCGTRLHQRLSILTIGLHDAGPRMLFRACRSNFLPYSPVWAPRGNQVLFVRRDDPQKPTATSRLQLLNLRGQLVAGAPRHRTGELSPSWQPLR
jgi:Tol biopolymer transport system component